MISERSLDRRAGQVLKGDPLPVTSIEEAKSYAAHKLRGADEPQRAPRAAHPHGCTCPRCDTTQYPCEFKPCAHVATGLLQRGSHRALHRRRKRRRQIFIAPDGLGYLRRVVTEKAISAVVNLGALTRFQRLLLGGDAASAPRKRDWRMTKLDKVNLAAYEAMGTNAAVALAPGKTTAASAAVIYRLALLAGVAPKSVVGALVCYGLEKLADELRASRKAPEVHVPTVQTKAAQKTAGAPTAPEAPAAFPTSSDLR